MKIIELSHKYGILLILDEVISGFRVSAGGMLERLGLKADIICYGKIIGEVFL